MAPWPLLPLHQREHLLVLARFANGAPGKVTVRAENHTWELLPTAAGEDDVLHLLLAREAIRELEDRLLGSWGSPLHEDRELKAQTLSLSRRYGLLSSLTSFLVVAERPGEEAGEMALRRIPVAMTQSWGGLEAARPYYNFKPCYLLRYASLDPFAAVPRVPSKIQGIRRPAKMYASPPPDGDEQVFRGPHPGPAGLRILGVDYLACQTGGDQLKLS